MINYRGFELRLLLENEAMQSPESIADALESAARKIRSNGQTAGHVLDVNGNTVGWFDLVTFKHDNNGRPQEPRLH